VGCTPKKWVSITSTPTSADLFLDGRNEGKTPYTKELRFKDKKTFEAVVKKKGYKPSTIEIKPEPREKTEYHFTLEQIFKKVRITTDPEGASVYINRQNAGTTPLVDKYLLFKEKKSFDVVVRKKGYEDAITAINLKPLDETDYHLPLNQIHKIVNIASTPDGAEIYINGENIGTTPINNEYLLFKDNVNFKVVAKKGPWYVDGSETIYLNPLEETNFHIRLKKSKTVPINLVSFEPQPTDAGVKLTKTVK
jgi:hypothetical protein